MFKKILLTTIFGLLIFPASIKAYEQIDQFDSQITIIKNSQIDVIEKIDYDFGTTPKHGIIRKIPLTKTNSYGKVFKTIPTLIYVRDENNLAYNYTKNNVGNYLEIKVGDANKTITGKHSYIIYYIFSGAIQNFPDHDELYWNVTGNEWNIPILKSTATIGFEKNLGDVNFTKLNCFTGVTDSSLSNCTYNIVQNESTFTTVIPLAEKEGFTVVASIPTGIIDKTLMTEYKSYGIMDYLSTLSFIFIINGFGFLVLLIIWFVNGRDPKHQIVVRQYEPPKDLNGKFLTPMEVGVIVDEVVNPRDMSAEILNLAIKKYIKITETEKKVFLFNTKEIKFERGPSYKTDEKFLNLSESEKETLRALTLMTHEESFLSDLKTTAPVVMQSIKSSMYKKVVSDGYFKSNPDSVRSGYMIAGFILLFLGNFILGIGLIAFAKIMPKKTETGVEAKRQALGLKQYLTSQDRQFEYMEKNYDLFEKLLPYAIVFGVAKIWAEKFKDLSNYAPDWYASNSGINNLNSIYIVDSLSRNLSTMEQYYTPTKTSSSSGFSSGFSGGSSGGGFGGGGGGSW